jgi:hypothetical protein
MYVTHKKVFFFLMTVKKIAIVVVSDSLLIQCFFLRSSLGYNYCVTWAQML